jgi:thiamine-monophosphate kinase
LSRWSEAKLIEWLRHTRGRRSPAVPTSIGDDATVLNPPAGRLVVTQDALVENVDFRAGWFGPELLARKACRANVSDLAAMGAEPWTCWLALAVDPGKPADYAPRFLSAFADEVERFGMSLVGGDLSSSDQVFISVTAMGVVRAGLPVLRSGGRPGDWVLLLGRVGWSRWGLEWLEAHAQTFGPLSGDERSGLFAADPEVDRALRAHILPEVPLQAALWLQRHGLVHAMIDISDGLGCDLQHLAEASGCRAELWLERIPPGPSRLGRREWEEKAINGGEDFALLAAVSSRQWRRIRTLSPHDWPSRRIIGRLRAGRPAVRFRRHGRPVVPTVKGYDHFRR